MTKNYFANYRCKSLPFTTNFSSNSLIIRRCEQYNNVRNVNLIVSNIKLECISNVKLQYQIYNVKYDIVGYSDIHNCEMGWLYLK